MSSTRCPRCGEDIGLDMKFCPQCGASIISDPPRSLNRREWRSMDALGLLSAAVILIILAVIFLRYPIGFSTIIEYFKQMDQMDRFFKPPLILLQAAIFFFYATGGWGLLLSGLRFVFERNVLKALSDMLGAVFSFFLAVLTTNYTADVFTTRATIAYFVIGLGSFLVITSLIHFVFSKKPGLDRSKNNIFS